MEISSLSSVCLPRRHTSMCLSCLIKPHMGSLEHSCFVQDEGFMSIVLPQFLIFLYIVYSDWYFKNFNDQNKIHVIFKILVFFK